MGEEPDHRFPIGNGSWSVWRVGLLRSAGFPADGLDRLAAPVCAAKADALLTGSISREEFVEAFELTQDEHSAELAAIAGDDLLREAVTWQNRAALVLLDGLTRQDGAGAHRSKRRYRERQLARLWQRYCAKAETIGFFGPALWATLTDDGTGLSVVPGPRVIDRRQVFLEPWALAALGAELARDPEVREWLPPSPVPHHVVTEEGVQRPGEAFEPLSAVERLAMSLCDGDRPACEVVREVRERTEELTVEEARDVLDRLVTARLLRWDINLPVGPQTEAMLDARLAAIGEPALRQRASAPLHELRRARDRVASASGSPDDLAVELAHLDDAFIEVTGRSAQRRAGQTYAGRGVCYEDTTRDVRVVIGRQVLDELAPALELVLTAAQWLTSEYARVLDRALTPLLDDRRVERPAPTLADLWDPAIDMIMGPADRGPFRDVNDDLERRWSTLFDLDGHRPSEPVAFSARQLADRHRDLFTSRGPGWSSARIHSPDILLCAPSADSINAGDYFAVLGELHVSYATLCDHWSTWCLPDPGRHLALAIEDFGQPRIVPLLPGVWSRDAGRVVQIEPADDDDLLGFARATGFRTDRLAPIGSIPVAHDDGVLVGRLPSGRTAPLVEFFAAFLSMAVVNAFRLVSAAPQSPRIAIDRMVVFRQTWQLAHDDLAALIKVRDPKDQYLEVRRLVAAHGLPRRCFAKVSSERKPIYVDFTSPSYTASFVSMIRAGQEAGRVMPTVSLSEMLPGPADAWLPDAAGNRYLSELRLHFTDLSRNGGRATAV